ncbi:MAG: MarC family protein [Fluviicola sp.]
MEHFAFLFGAIFSVMNPLGTVPVFVELARNLDDVDRRKVCLKTCLNVLVILFISFFLGTYILSFFGISVSSLRLAGGLVICSSGFALLTGSFTKHKGMKRVSVQEDLKARKDFTLTPLALPMLAGPGTISLLIGFNNVYKSTTEILLVCSASVVVVGVIYFVLRSSNMIVKKMGASGLNATSRIIGFVVIAIGIEMIAKSVFEYGKLFLENVNN